MGHIVNAKSTRIGWSTIWCDQWYSEVLYYAEYLHAIFRIRFYCIYTFTRRHLDKKAIFYSHFEILKYYKNLYVEIYYYDGKLESDYEDFKFEFFIRAYNLEINKDPETRIPFFLHTPLKIIIIWKLFQWFDFDEWNDREVGSLAFLLKGYKVKRLMKFFKKKKKQSIWFPKRFNLAMLVFFSVYNSSRELISKWSIWKSPKRNTTLRRFYMAGVAMREIDKFIVPFAILLGYTFEKLTNFFKVNVFFFLTNNNCVNAKFLSRFIARKLRQKYTVKSLLRPIRKELKFVMKMSSTPIQSYYKIIDKKYIDAFKNRKLKDTAFKILLSLIFLIFTKNLLVFFNKNKIWFNLDFLVIYISFNKTIQDLNSLIYLSYKYFKTKCGYLCFFESKFDIDVGNLWFLPKFDLKLWFSNRYKYSNFVNFIYDFLYINKSCLWNFNTLNLMPKLSVSSFRASNIHFNRYLKFNYWNFNYGSLSKEFKVNHLKSRIKEHTTSNNIKGYKMHLSGRFKRKQRASSFWFSYGKVPLNTITSFVDYAFFTLPLANSAITVKVWLYKSSYTYNIFYYKLN